MELVTSIGVSALGIFREAALYLLLGFLVAGALRVYLKPATVMRFFKRRTARSVLYASALGIPVPL